MALPVREPGTALARLHDEIDRMFEGFTLPDFFSHHRAGGRWSPALDMYEKDGNLIVETELPGIPREAVKINCSDHTLTIQGETKKEEEEKREGYHRSERRYGSFYRSVSLPEGVSAAKATAQFKDGVLKITMPRQAKPEEKSQTIPISG
jgi:HSP20 family protein